MPDDVRSRTTWLARVADLLVRRVVGPISQHSSRLAAHAVVLLLLPVGALVALGCTAVAAEVYESVEESGDLAGLDRPSLQTAQEWRSETRNGVVTAFTDLGGTVGFPIVAIGLLGLAAFLLRRWEPLVLGLLVLPIGLAMSMVGKAAVGRVRPPQSAAVPPYEHSPSFPSGHALMTTALMTLLAYLAVRHLPRLWQQVLAVCACAAYAIAMGLSRVFLGHHWLTDVAAGWALGFGWVIAVVTLHQAWLLLGPRRAQPADAQTQASP